MKKVKESVEASEQLQNDQDYNRQIRELKSELERANCSLTQHNSRIEALTTENNHLRAQAIEYLGADDEHARKQGELKAAFKKELSELKKKLDLATHIIVMYRRYALAILTSEKAAEELASARHELQIRSDGILNFLDDNACISKVFDTEADKRAFAEKAAVKAARLSVQDELTRELSAYTRKDPNDKGSRS